MINTSKSNNDAKNDSATDLSTKIINDLLAYKTTDLTADSKVYTS